MKKWINYIFEDYENKTKSDFSDFSDELKAEIESHIQSRISDLAMKAIGEQFAVNQTEDGELPQHEQNENEHEDEEEDENIDEGMTMG